MFKQIHVHNMYKYFNRKSVDKLYMHVHVAKEKHILTA